MKKLVMVVAAAALVAATGQAMPVFQVNGDATGQSVSGVNGGSPYYWAGNSSDGTNATIGNWATGTGYFAGHTSSPNIALANLRSFLGAGATTPDALTYEMTGAPTTFTIKVEVAGLSGANQLWYRQGSNLTRIFDGAAGANQSTSVTITGEFELFVIRGLAGTTATDSDLNGSGVEWARSGGGSNKTRKGTEFSDLQKFATFQNTLNPGTLYTGIEDLWPPDGSDNDYNDLIIAMGLEETPAPPAIVLVALGVPALGLARRFTRKAPAAVVA